jgi:hypothetical protein
VLAALVREEHVVRNIADEVVGVVVAAGRCRWWRRRLATVVVVAVIDVTVPAVAIVDVPVVVSVVVVGRLRGPALVPVAVSNVLGTPLCSPFPGPERVPGRGRDGERRVTPQVRREQGLPPHDL